MIDNNGITTAFLLLKLKSHSDRNKKIVIRQLSKSSNIKDFHPISGDYDFIAKVEVCSILDLDRLIMTEIASI